MRERLTYAIGDVHGRLDLLLMAAVEIQRHSAGRQAHTIALGDYVDRGPDSRGVIEFLMRWQKDGELTCLKGNHEAMMVDACRSDDTRRGVRWLAKGGEETLASYAGAVGDGLNSDVLVEHLEWMNALPCLLVDEHRAYVHAGVQPRRPLADNDERICLWIREKFLLARGKNDFEKHIVHGHTPLWAEKPHLEHPELLPYRTNLDTGAYSSGVLTIGVFDNQTAGGPVELITIHE